MISVMEDHTPSSLSPTELKKRAESSLPCVTILLISVLRMRDSSGNQGDFFPKREPEELDESVLSAR